MILNPTYYNSLLSLVVESEYSANTPKVVSISASLILLNYSKRNIHINTPNSQETYSHILSIIFEKLSISIFQKYADFPPLKKGDLVKRIDTKGNDLFFVKQIIDNNVTLQLKKNSSKCPMHERFLKYDSLLKHYTPVIQNAKDKTIKKYHDYFAEINTYGFLPTFFSKKNVFIASKNKWDNIGLKSCLPVIYLPNSRDENQTLIKSIPALNDCITYFTPRYEVCFEQLLERGEIIDTIVLCDTDLDMIPQIIQDQARFNFKLIILSNRDDNLRFNEVLSWNWKREELNLLNQL